MKTKFNANEWIKNASSSLYEAKTLNTKKTRQGLKRRTQKKLVKKPLAKLLVARTKYNGNLFNSEIKFFSSEIETKQEAQTEAGLILCHCLNISKVDLYCKNDLSISEQEKECLANFLERRINGEPLAYIFGRKEFYGLNFLVNSSTLIPRPETEFLVDEVVKFQKSKASKALLLDLGSGSGCIGLSVLYHYPNFRAIFVDISRDALAIAKENAKRLNLEHLCYFYLADFTNDNFKQDILNTARSNMHNPKQNSRPFDIIVSNPPYIPKHEYEMLHKSVKDYEPKQALLSNDFNLCHGAYHISKVINLAEATLKPKGLFLLEHGYNQGNIAKNLCNQSLWQELETKKDYAKNSRYLKGIFA